MDEVIKRWFAKLLRLFATNDDPYDERSGGYWRELCVERTLTATTPARFKVEYRVTCVVRRVDDRVFRALGMLEDNKIDVLVDEYIATCLLPFLAKDGFFKLHLSNRDWPFGPQRAGVLWVRFTAKDDGDHLKLDQNGIVTMADVGHLQFAKYGCAIASVKEFRVCSLLDNPQLLKENLSMLSATDLEQLKGDIQYRQFEEHLAALALQRLMELEKAKTDRVFETHNVHITTRLEGNVVIIEWHFHGPALHANWFLLGFRKEGGFALDKWSETENGTLVIDSQRPGHTVETLEPGKAYFYTFYLRSNESKMDCTRFSIRISPSSELPVNAVPPKVSDSHEERRRQLIQGMGQFKQLLNLFTVEEQSGIKEILAEKLPPHDEQEKIALWREHIQNLRSQHL